MWYEVFVSNVECVLTLVGRSVQVSLNLNNFILYLLLLLLLLLYLYYIFNFMCIHTYILATE